MNNIFSKYKGQICLLLAAIIWGSAFIFQKMGMDYIGPFTFGIFRFALGALALLPVIWIYTAINNKKPLEKRGYVSKWNDKTLLLGSFLCGLSNFIAGSVQQIGIVYTTAGKAGFITSMDIVIVPILMLFLRRKVERWTWLGIAMAFIGLWMLCITDGLHIAKGDTYVIICAFVYSIQILLIDHFAERTDVLKLSFLQFMLAGILSIPFAIALETIELQSILDCAGPILYVALLEVSIAFTLQIVGQKYTSPAPATIIISLESLFAALSGALFLHETMSSRELTGCIIMFIAFIIAQIPEMRSKD